MAAKAGGNPQFSASLEKPGMPITRQRGKEPAGENPAARAHTQARGCCWWWRWQLAVAPRGSWAVGRLSSPTQFKPGPAASHAGGAPLPCSSHVRRRFSHLRTNSRLSAHALGSVQNCHGAAHGRKRIGPYASAETRA